ncbi:MAG: hypothetical protein D6795_02950 [Deltaproteobacteria bacterium]|nr:MAG: hypothetical protein D6795_02950 [Deltaproteobacteria bacterium]
MNGWIVVEEGTGEGGFVEGPEGAPLGTGSFRMATGPGEGDQGGKVWLMTGNFEQTELSAITGMRYATFVPSEGSTPLAPYLNLQLDLDRDGRRDTTIVFDPAEGDAGEIEPGVWQTWDAAAGRWYFTAATEAFCARTCYATLPEILSAHPTATIVAWYPNRRGISIVAGQASGGAWNDFIGYVDAFSIAIEGEETRYDFEASGGGCAP